MDGVSSSPFDPDFQSENEFNNISTVVTNANEALEPLKKELEVFKNRGVVLIIDPSEGKIGIIIPIRITEINEQLKGLKTQFESDTSESRAKFIRLVSPINRLFKELILFCNSYSRAPPLSII